MDKKELLIQMYESNDRKRRRLLMDIFYHTITMNASLKFICKLINNELSRDDLVSEKDVVYCRFHFAKNSKPSPLPKIPTKQITVTPKEVNTNTEIVWSDPDDDNFKKQISIKSKFSKE